MATSTSLLEAVSGSASGAELAALAGPAKALHEALETLPAGERAKLGRALDRRVRRHHAPVLLLSSRGSEERGALALALRAPSVAAARPPAGSSAPPPPASCRFKPP